MRRIAFLVNYRIYSLHLVLEKRDFSMLNVICDSKSDRNVNFVQIGPRRNTAAMPPRNQSAILNY